MARLYFDFKTNVEHRNEQLNAPQLDALIFETKDGSVLRIICADEHDWDLGTDRILSGRWKGLEYSIEDKDGNTVKDWTDEDNTETLCTYLDGAKVVAFYLDNDDLAANGYDESFVPECKDININVEILPYVKDGESTLREFEFHEKNLATEEDYLNGLHEKEDVEMD